MSGISAFRCFINASSILILFNPQFSGNEFNCYWEGAGNTTIFLLSLEGFLGHSSRVCLYSGLQLKQSPSFSKYGHRQVTWSRDRHFKQFEKVSHLPVQL